MPHHDAIIVGAGLAGMACARRLLGDAIVPTIFEASDQPGGRVRSDVIDGHICDRGFQLLLTQYPEAQLVLDYRALDLQPFDPGAAVFTGGALHALSDPLRKPATVVDTLRAPVGSVFDKAKILPLVLKLRQADAADLLRDRDMPTLESLVAAGFSARMIDTFFRPLFAGISLDPELEVSSRFFSVILRSLALGDAAVPAGGMGAIAADLARQLPADGIRYGSPVTEVTGGPTPSVVVHGERHTADSVIVATEGPAAARLLDLPDPGSAPVAALWFAADEPPNEQKAIILDGDRTGPAVNVAIMSNVAPTYAPPGRATIVAAVPGRRATSPSLLADVRRQLEGMFGRSVRRWSHLTTQVIAHGHPDQRPPFDPKQRVDLGDGLFVCGDHRDTASIQGALHSGRRCAQAVVHARRGSTV